VAENPDLRFLTVQPASENVPLVFFFAIEDVRIVCKIR
jgi:hypothetical protein